jgi:hypothetical protein
MARLLATAAARPDYLRDIKPILASRCAGCHGSFRHKAGVRVDTAAFLKQGNSDGPLIVPGKPAESRLIAVVTGARDVPLMPPVGDRLSARQITLLRRWIDGGAIAPAHEKVRRGTTRHWAFQPLVRPAVPKGRDASWVRNPIDAFLDRGYAQRGLRPNPPLSKSLLLRRVYLDLVGLPPTRAALHSFLADNSPEAYEKVVDRLLASPRYGERWGRHWLDIWRYSDPDGRKSHKDIWWSNPFLWRWRDWVVRSLNRDKSYDRTIVEMLAGDEAVPNNPDALAGTGFLVRNWFKLNRNVWLNSTVEHTAKAFLGLTVHCARCHDHKFDPISQEEYYRFRAFFEPHEVRVDRVAFKAGAKPVEVARVFDQYLDRPTYLFVRGNENNPDKKTALSPGVPAVLAGVPVDVRPVKILNGRGKNPRYTMSTGRRLALARWLTDRQQPLTARVAVNHIWLRHFGKPLVDSVADFGVRSKAPLHQALLDWLAVEFMKPVTGKSWSMKRLHRLIVTSTAYQMQSAVRGAAVRNQALDPDNRYFWRMNQRRLESELVRDGLLHLAGQLDGAMGGPPLDPGAGERCGRRSLYFRYSREDKLRFLTLFDAAGVDECYQREESIVPSQALALTNGDFAWSQARRIARRIAPGHEDTQAPMLGVARSELLGVARPESSKGVGAKHALRGLRACHPVPMISPQQFVIAAFEQVLCRRPAPAELAACSRFLDDQAERFANPGRLTPFPGAAPATVRPAADPLLRAREHLVHVLLNHNDFVTIR